MTLVFEPLDETDINYVLDNLWERGSMEAEAFGFKTKADILAYILSVSSEYGYVLKHDEKPVAVFGASYHSGCYYTWFIGTEDFAQVGKSATRYLDGILKRKVKEKPSARLEMLSAVDHPEAERWFNILGFKLEKKDGIFSRYVYQREKS